MTDETVKALKDLKPGDYCWMLNGVRSRAFLCEVVSRGTSGDGIITVKNLDKHGQWFDFKALDGKPVRGYYVPFNDQPATPTLVVYTDPHAQQLNVGRIHREYREKITKLIHRIPAEDLFDEVLDTIEEWQTKASSDV